MNDPVAIFGGTFDPVHYGHLRAASEAQEKLAIKDFRLLPAGQPPHRVQPIASARQRLNMLQLALKDHPDLLVDDREIHRNGPSFMVDTLELLRAECGHRPLILILGQDAANHLDAWHRWRELFDLAHLVVMTRPESPSQYQGELAAAVAHHRIDTLTPLQTSSHGHLLHLRITQLAISSTNIRRQIQHQKNPRFLLPESVLQYIHQHHLY